MARLSEKEFMEKVKVILGDRTDDDALSFLEDCKDTITESNTDYKQKYEEEVQKNKDLDESWKKKYRDRFYDSDANDNKDNDNGKGKGKDDPFDMRSDEQKQAESITIDDLFKESEE